MFLSGVSRNDTANVSLPLWVWRRGNLQVSYFGGYLCSPFDNQMMLTRVDQGGSKGMVYWPYEAQAVEWGCSCWFAEPFLEGGFKVKYTTRKQRGSCQEWQQDIEPTRQNPVNQSFDCL